MTHPSTTLPVTALTPPTEVVQDVAELPDVAFGPEDMLWWGTLGFVVIEGFTLALCAVVYLYLWKNFPTWPPAGTELPTLGVPTAQVLLMMLSVPVAIRMRRGARRFDYARVRNGLTMLTLFGAAFCALRAVELLKSLHVRWDSNAYGSAQWLVLGAHATLLAVELVEVAGLALFFWIGRADDRHVSDADDSAFYWLFMVLAWVPLYFMCFWGPRWAH